MPSTQKLDDKLVKVNKWDGNATKNALDDAVRKVVLDSYGYAEKTGFIDTRLVIATIAVAFAIFGLLWDWKHPFPQSRSVLIVCVAAYFILIGALQLYATFVERGTFLVAIDDDPTGTIGDTHWSFSSKLKRFDHYYTLEISLKQRDRVGQASVVKSIAEFFDDEGSLIVNKVNAEVYKLHDTLLTKKVN